MTSPARSYFGCQPGSAIVAGADAVISSGTDAPNDTDGKPDGSIYFQI